MCLFINSIHRDLLYLLTIKETMFPLSKRMKELRVSKKASPLPIKIRSSQFIVRTLKANKIRILRTRPPRKSPRQQRLWSLTRQETSSSKSSTSLLNPLGRKNFGTRMRIARTSAVRVSLAAESSHTTTITSRNLPSRFKKLPARTPKKSRRWRSLNLKKRNRREVVQRPRV